MSGKARKRSAFYQSVDQGFYAELAKSNGGKLPPDLVLPDGSPRKLTRSTEDAKYRQTWSKIADEKRNSKAVQKPVGCKACQAASKKWARPPATPPKFKPKPIPCKHGDLEVKCGCKGRGYSLKRTAGSAAPSNLVLSVLLTGEGKGDTITAGTQILAGPCPTHKGKVFDVSPEDPMQESGLIKSDSQLTVKCIPISLGVSCASDALKVLWPRSIETRDYDIKVQTCEGENFSVTIRAYPQVEWKVLFKFGSEQTSSFDARGDTKGEDEYTSAIEAELKLSGGKCYKLGAEIKDKVKAIVEYFNQANRLYKHIAKMAQKLGGAEITVKPPSFSVEGEWGWKEISNSPYCGFEVRTKLAASPAIGIAGKIDVLPAISNYVPPLRALLDCLLFTYGEHFKASLEFSAGAEVSGELEFNKILYKENFEITGEIKGGIPLKFEGIAGDKGNVFFVSAGGGVKLGTKSSIAISGKGGDDEEGLFVSGKIGFNAINLYREAYASLSFNWGDPPPDENSKEKPESAKLSTSDGTEWTVWEGLTLDGTHHFVKNHSGSLGGGANGE